LPKSDGLSRKVKNLKKRRVLILIDTATGWGRNIIRGIARFARETGDWDLFLQPRGQIREIPVPPRWEGEGIIARIASQHQLAEIKRTGLPAVNVSSLRFPECPYPRIISDFEMVGKMAADHLMDIGISKFAFSATKTALSYSAEVYQSYRSHLQSNGFSVSDLILSNRNLHSESQKEKIEKWLLAKKEQPLGIFAPSIEAPHAILSACDTAGIRIPDDVALISNASIDEIVLQITNPAVSCVATSEQTIGYEAARRLYRMLDKGRREEPKETHRVEPSHIEIRASSDILRIPDEPIRRALRFIADNAQSGIQVSDVAAHIGLSRRRLELRMKKVARRTPAEEIRRERLRIACRLLATSHLPIPEVAEKAGFGTVEHFIVFFKRATGQTPLQYGKRHHRVPDL